MSIVTLPTPNRLRRYNAVWCDATPRLYVYNPVWSNSTHAYDGAFSATLERYDPGANTWTNLTSAGAAIQRGEPSIRDAATAKWYRVCGQNALTSASVKTVEIYDEASDTWSFGPAFSSPGAGRIGVVGWIDGSGTIYAGGGSDSTGGPQKDLYILSGGAWVAKTSATSNYGVTQSRALVDTSGRAYFFGTDASPSPIQRYDPTANAWTTLPNPALTLLQPSVCIASSDLVYAVSTNGHALKYDPTPNTWTTMAASPVTGILQSSGASIYDAASNAMYWFSIFLSSTFVYSPSMYKYDIATDTWSTLSETMSARGLQPIGIVADGLGGYYLGQGSDPSNDAVNVVEYFVPGAVAAVTTSSIAQIVG